MENTVKKNPLDRATRNLIFVAVGALLSMAAISTGFHYLAPAPVARNSAWVMLIGGILSSSLLAAYSPKTKPFWTKFCKINSYLLWIGFVISVLDWNPSAKQHEGVAIFLPIFIVLKLPFAFNNPFWLRAMFDIKDTDKLPPLFAFFESPRYPYWAINAVAIVSLCLMYSQTTFATHLYLVVLALVSTTSIGLSPVTLERRVTKPSPSTLSPQ